MHPETVDECPVRHTPGQVPYSRRRDACLFCDAELIPGPSVHRAADAADPLGPIAVPVGGRNFQFISYLDPICGRPGLHWYAGSPDSRLLTEPASSRRKGRIAKARRVVLAGMEDKYSGPHH